MTNGDTPSDPDQLREEIARTRAELGETVQSLAAKADVKARAKDAAVAAGDRARQKAADVSGKAAHTAAVVKDQAVDAVNRGSSVVREKMADPDASLPVRQPLPWAVLGAAAVVAGLVIFIVRRRRS